MKKLSITAVLVALMATSAFAHPGSVGLFANDLGTDCDADATLYLPFDIYLGYQKFDAGPNGILGGEFKIVLSDPVSFVITGTTWSPAVILTNGSWAAGMAFSFSSCQGTDETFVYIATLTILNTMPSPGATAYIATSDALTFPPYAPLVAECPYPQEVVGVLGGWYHFTNGECNMAVQPSTWGAIKNLE